MPEPTPAVPPLDPSSALVAGAELAVSGPRVQQSNADIHAAPMHAAPVRSIRWWQRSGRGTGMLSDTGSAPAPGTAPEIAPDIAPALLRRMGDGARWACFLDLDGTLIDIAPRPQDVVCPPGLPRTLAKLHAATGGTVAVVTGRSVQFARDLLGLPDLTIAGLHGADIRMGRTALTTGLSADRLTPVARHVATLAADLPGVLLEDKQGAFALHFRLAPQMEPAVTRIMQDALAMAGPDYCLKPGKAVVELCPVCSDKGAALQRLMQEPAFRGRRPFAAGDDLTDEAMFTAAWTLGGTSLRVGERGTGRTAARYQVATPAEFRQILSLMARELT